MTLYRELHLVFEEQNDREMIDLRAEPQDVVVPALCLGAKQCNRVFRTPSRPNRATSRADVALIS